MSAKIPTKKQRSSARAPERRSVPAHVMRNIAFGMIAIAVVCSYFLTPLPIAVGMTVLAVIRLWIVLREERKEAGRSPEQPQTVCSSR